ncbi:MAG: polymer-forming cytoskeletal protein [Desulfobacterales bacterium]|nr:polymer-forming cytoskeletal protein [Desulfobacterales bacterium]
MSKDTRGRAPSVVSRNMKIDGEVRGKENLSIEGFVKGVIQLDGNLLVEGAGVVEADVEATNVVIRGKVSGNVKARGQLEIHATGKLFGVIHAGSIDIKEGAVFEGRSHMISKSTSAAPPASAPASSVKETRVKTVPASSAKGTGVKTVPAPAKVEKKKPRQKVS